MEIQRDNTTTLVRGRSLAKERGTRVSRVRAYYNTIEGAPLTFTLPAETIVDPANGEEVDRALGFLWRLSDCMALSLHPPPPHPSLSLTHPDTHGVKGKRASKDATTIPFTRERGAIENELSKQFDWWLRSSLTVKRIS